MLKVLASSLIMLSFSEVQAIQTTEDSQTNELSVLENTGIHLTSKIDVPVTELTGTGFAWHF